MITISEFQNDEVVVQYILRLAMAGALKGKTLTSSPTLRAAIFSKRLKRRDEIFGVAFLRLPKATFRPEGC
jgi:hypothetical protein